MNTKRKAQLEREIQIITNITLEAQESIFIVEYLLKEEDEDFVYEKKTGSFFYFCKFTFWQKTVLELSKIYQDREKFNLIKLISKLQNDGEYSQTKITESILADWINKIELSKSEIDNLKLQRDKAYAHEDGQSDKIGNTVSIEEIKKLTDLAFNIINSVRKSLETPYLQTELLNSPANNLKYIFERLVNEKRTKLNAYRGLAKQYGLENELPPE